MGRRRAWLESPNSVARFADEHVMIQLTDGSRAYCARPPLGSGPGVLLLHDGDAASLASLADRLGEDGYTVLLPEAAPDVTTAVAAVRALPSFRGRIGVIGFGAGGRRAVEAAAARQADCAVSYYAAAKADGVPVVLHLVDAHEVCGHEDFEVYGYPESDRAFATPGSPGYFKPAADMAYSRTLALLRRVLGPYYDLSSLWEAHRRCEFETRDADATMATMVAQPYVNHIPTLTGGYGQAELHRFYKHHFIPKSPKDMRNIPISRTVGADRVVNEGILCFTHDTEIDWMLPGVPPTGCYVEVGLVGIVTFRGDKLFHEHIYWDQASVLVQVGLLDPAGLPVAGADAARKILDPSRPSNALMKRWRESEGK
jgi:carboxymethylenebutenolidase